MPGGYLLRLKQFAEAKLVAGEILFCFFFKIPITHLRDYSPLGSSSFLPSGSITRLKIARHLRDLLFLF